MRFDYGLRLAGMAFLMVAIAGGVLVTPAAAQRGRPSSAQIKQYQQQMQQYQQNQYGMELVLEKRRKEMFSKYDLDGDGKLNSKEKPAFDKYLREVKSGKQPNLLDPSTITQQDIDAALKSTSTAKTTPAANPQQAKKPTTTN